MLLADFIEITDLFYLLFSKNESDTHENVLVWNDYRSIGKSRRIINNDVVE